MPQNIVIQLLGVDCAADMNDYQLLLSSNKNVCSYEARITYKCSYAVIRSAKKIVTSISGQGVRSQSTTAAAAAGAGSNSDERTTESSWRSYVRRWQWKIPIGLGISFLAVLQWRYFRKRHEDETNKGPIEGLMVSRCHFFLIFSFGNYVMDFGFVGRVGLIQIK